MYEHNQIEVPASFLAIYSKNGRPSETRAFVESRYEACETLAQKVSEYCETSQFKDDLSEAEVLRRCHLALSELPDNLPAETQWVICRVAEMLDWSPPELASPEAN